MLVHVFVFHGLLALYDDPSALANRDDFGAIEIGGRYVKTTLTTPTSASQENNATKQNNAKRKTTDAVHSTETAVAHCTWNENLKLRASSRCADHLEG